MRVELKTKKLEEIMSIIIKGVATKADQMILSGIYLKAKDNTLEITATNNEISIITHMEATIKEEGELVVGGKYFLDIAKRLPSDTLTLSTSEKEQNLSIKSGTANFSLLIMNKEDFPSVHRLDMDNNIEKTIKLKIKDNEFKKMIKKTTFAAATTEGSVIFTGTLLDIDEGKIKTVATNSHCLAYNEYQIEGSGENRKIIIPSKTLDEIERLLSLENEQDIEIFISGNQIAFVYKGIYIAERLLDGTFPNYENVIPKTFNTKITLQTEEFISALERVSFISRFGAYNIVRLEFIDDILHIYSNNPEIGTAEDTLKIQKEGCDITIAFNADYLIKALKNIDTKEFHFLLSEPLKSGKILEPENEKFIYVITPVRLN